MPTEDSEDDPPIIPANPVVVVQGVGHLSREFMREVGSLFWFMVQTLDETVERIRDGPCSISCLEFLPRTANEPVLARFRWSVWFHFFSA